MYRAELAKRDEGFGCLLLSRGGRIYVRAASGPAEGRPILELPARGDRIVAVDLEEGSSEALALRAIDAAVGAVVGAMPASTTGMSREANRDLGRHKQLCLEVLRQSCNGLDGRVKVQDTRADALTDFRRFNEVCRIYDQRCRDARSRNGAAGAGAGVLAYSPPLMTPGDASRTSGQAIGTKPQDARPRACRTG